MDQDLQKEPAFHEDLDAGMLKKIIERHSAVVRRQKEAGHKKLYGMRCIVDDFADSAEIMHKRSGSVLRRLFLSGRHHGISTIVSVQKLTLVYTPIRVIATGLLLFKVRGRAERDVAVNFVSALLNAGEFKQLYAPSTNSRTASCS